MRAALQSRRLQCGFNARSIRCAPFHSAPPASSPPPPPPSVQEAKIAIHINGSEHHVNPGGSILDACVETNHYGTYDERLPSGWAKNPCIVYLTELSSTVPTLCYHPCLSISGHCRVCLIEVSKGTAHSKLVPACATNVRVDVKSHRMRNED